MSPARRARQRLPYGFSLLNDGKYSLDVNVRDIGLTVLRSPVYAHHMPGRAQAGGAVHLHRSGHPALQLSSCCPTAAVGRQAGTVRRAAELNQPPDRAARDFPPRRQRCRRATVSSTCEPENGDGDRAQAGRGRRRPDRARGRNGRHRPAHGTIRLPKWERVIEARTSRRARSRPSACRATAPNRWWKPTCWNGKLMRDLARRRRLAAQGLLRRGLALARRAQARLA